MDSPKTVIDGAEILLDYTLSTEHDILDSTEGVGPLSLKIGQKQIHPAIENCLLGRRQGESFEINIDPSLAFGDFDPALRTTISKTKYPKAFENLKCGDIFESKDSKGKPKKYRVIEIKGDELFVDGNHPLAGETVELRATILEIK